MTATFAPAPVAHSHPQQSVVPRARPATHRDRPKSRDRFVDVLRVAAILVVVAEHWLMPVLAYQDGRLTTGNALAAPGAWAITWLSQVMPLVFFAGGAAAAWSLRARQARLGTTAGDRSVSRAWLADRLIRLAWPVLPLAAVWIPLPYVLGAIGVPAQPIELGARLVGQLLWFLAAYVVVIALTPVLQAAHRRWAGWEIGALAAAAVGVDALRFAFDAEALGYANVVFVWAAVYQVGIAYASGRFSAIAGRRALVVAAAGFGVTALAVAVGPYPTSMIGMPGTPMSNMNPPTAVLLALAVGQLGLALAARPFIERWAAQARVARGLDALSKRSMSLYLWHTPALIVVAGLTIVGFGLSTPEPFSSGWRWGAPLWLATLAGVLALTVRGVARFEHPRLRSVGRVPGTAAVGLATILVGIGMLTLTVEGFTPAAQGSPPPALWASISLAGGVALLRRRP